MSKQTPNLKLFKPELTDPADITALNQNWDIIDEKLTNLPEEDTAPAYTYGTEDLEAGVTELETGKLHFVYE